MRINCCEFVSTGDRYNMTNSFKKIISFVRKFSYSYNLNPKIFTFETVCLSLHKYYDPIRFLSLDLSHSRFSLSIMFFYPQNTNILFEMFKHIMK